MTKEEILEKLRASILKYDSDAAKNASEEALEKGVAPLEALDVLLETTRHLGEKFASFEIILPELMLAAEALEAGQNILTAAIPKESIQKIGTVVIGTVKGDIHYFGKDIVATMLRASGFDVRDLGGDVPIPNFAENAKKANADIVALSALMTTTMPVQKDVVDYFTALGIREKYKILVGGGPVTQEYAEEIGADGYAADAIAAVQVAKKLLSKP